MLPPAPVETEAASESPLTLAAAEAIAEKNQPLIKAAQLRARAAQQRIRERESDRLPIIAFNATGSLVADTDTATASGALTTSSISDRFAYGGTLSQLVTDFGRTSALVNSQRAEADAERDRSTLTRAAVRLHLRQAYYRVLGAEAVLHAAQEAQRNRELISRQIGALAQGQLRSTLDVNFAGVLQSQAELAVVQARSIVAQQRAYLAVAIGSTNPVNAPLVAPEAPPAPPAGDDALMQEAASDRADLQAARSEQAAAERYATAQQRLSYPSLHALGAAGEIPYHDHTLHDNYAAAGFNLQIPIFNGGLFHAEQQEASLNASARASDVREQQLEVSAQVRQAVYAIEEAFQSIAVTTRLVAQSREALRLAQARYDAGLGSIVELNEAQLNETSAEVSAADANFTYLARYAALDYATGRLN